MSLTESQIKEVLARLPREEKETLVRLPVKEAMVILEMHHYFPGTRRVEE